MVSLYISFGNLLFSQHTWIPFALLHSISLYKHTILLVDISVVPNFFPITKFALMRFLYISP